MDADEHRYTFAQVFDWEQRLLDAARQPGQASAETLKKGPADAAPPIGDLYKKSAEHQWAGLALSGGGIRSATFNLGVLQALADLGLLRHFDYLSTVSGGGYIGGWLSKWIYECGGKVDTVEDLLCAATEGPDSPRTEAEPVRFLRRYSNFLTPKTGFFSADTWTLIGTYIRNTSLNLAMLIAWMTVLLLVPRCVLWLVDCPLRLRDQMLGASLIMLLTVASMALNISLKAPALRAHKEAQSQAWVLWSVCLPLMLSCFLGSIALLQHRAALAAFGGRVFGAIREEGWWLLVPGLIYFVFWATGWGAAQLLNRRGMTAAEKAASPARTMSSRLSEAFGHLSCAVGALALGSLLLVHLCAKYQTWLSRIDVVQLTTFGMPLMLLLFGATLTLMIGLIGRLYSDASREWWARQGAWTIILAIGWLLLFCSAFYLPAVLAWAFHNYATQSTLAAAASTLITYLGLKSGAGKQTGSPAAPSRLELVALVAPYAFSMLFIGLLTTGIQAILSTLPEVMYPPTLRHLANLPYFVQKYLYDSAQVDIGRTVCLCAICLAAAAVLGWRLDINKFSLYMMYRLRLVRAYFGASSPSRTPHPFTGFDSNDDIKLHDLLAQREAKGGAPGKVQRPYHLCNAALNLVGGKELAWQTRKAANFCFSPGHCGFELPAGSSVPRGAYRSTRLYASRSVVGDDSDNVVKLGTAVAVSGAAASPNMGYHSSPPLSFLMTLFNLRLGRWSPNPAIERVWKRASPRIGLFSILSELFGLTDAGANFLYLSDGGHFENLGLYELVRRRCQLIVVVDASCDDKYNFGDLGNAIRKCLTDFNVPITLDVHSVYGATAGAKPSSSCVIGRILYKQADGGDQVGVLLYMKPAVTGCENADVFNYSRLHPEFPHQSTADQWFDENQFDSYRSLGRHVAGGALSTAVATARAAAGPDAPGFVQRLCVALAAS
jgi:hypothetical protein